MFNPSRDQARRFFFDAWEKHQSNRPLTPLEGMAVDLVLCHPEYHAILANPDRYLDQDFLPENGETNPFLHLQLHLAVEEQLSIDQPAGILGHYHRLLAREGDAMAAQHHLMECLAETLWQAQLHGTAPDAAVYLSCLQRR
jgi:hypothetical protein